LFVDTLSITIGINLWFAPQISERCPYNRPGRLIENLTWFSRLCVASVFFCDLHKAFDCVNHNILLDKLEFYGISGTANKLMQSYLESRHQRVVLKDNLRHRITSDWIPMAHEIPQGNVLGPLMFVIYINDLSAHIRKITNPVFFADDTSIIFTSTEAREYQTIISQVTSETSKWCQVNLLTLNLKKHKHSTYCIESG
jgi:hypothetical protein